MNHYTHAQLPGLVGRDIALADWLEVDQRRIDLFAEATDDDQWIHIDVERAKTGPFGTTVAHGYLTLSLIAGFSQRTWRIDDETMSINYGLNKVRFPAPVRAGSRVRARFTLQSCRPVEGGPTGRGGLELVTVVTIELEGSAKPACVAEAIRVSYL
ncbi:MAG TPA: MaoC family dehydratase [Burkholderiaceae bacterium]|nr:MaoC family dehydratase [Burkholderiaceae bacterium]